ncbi:sensor histidine kinase [Agrococcus sp. DT81.2]|uniref:sensor histidine kinase n=1 Tax=Agrococcus sp. DT81.2 TaxID=3393414 RepID=UPI003CE4886A
MRVPPAAIDVALVVLALLDATFSSAREGGAPMALSVVAALGLAVRRRWPYLSFGLSLPALFVAYVLIAPLAALYTIAATARNRWHVVVSALVTAAGYYLPWPLTEFSWYDHEHGTVDLLGLIYTAVYVGAPVALGVLAQTKRDLSSSLAEIRASQDREQRLIAERVLAQERARLAREMHDAVSHQVSLIAVQAGALRVTAPNEEVRASAQTIRQLSVRTLDELRHMIGVLRRSDTSPIDVAPQPRLADIARLVEDSGSNATVDLHAVNGREWSEPTERAAYRTVQEGLTNIRKHAPGAAVNIRIRPRGTGLHVSVRNGSPATPPTSDLPTGGHGLAGLRERAELLGGGVEAGPTDEGGFLLEATLPDPHSPAHGVAAP